jgi:hypothetical protein
LRAKTFNYVTSSASWIATLVFVELLDKSSTLPPIASATGAICGLIASAYLTYDGYLREVKSSEQDQ